VKHLHARERPREPLAIREIKTMVERLAGGGVFALRKLQKTQRWGGDAAHRFPNGACWGAPASLGSRTGGNANRHRRPGARRVQKQGGAPGTLA